MLNPLIQRVFPAEALSFSHTHSHAITQAFHKSTGFDWLLSGMTRCVIRSQMWAEPAKRKYCLSSMSAFVKRNSHPRGKKKS